MTEWGRQWGKLVDLMRDEAIAIQNVGGEGYYLVSPTKLADRLLNNGVIVQEWIPVEDRLPEEKSKVLVFWFGNVHEVTYLEDGTFETLARQCVISGRDVTHWMLMPEPPKEDNHETD